MSNQNAERKKREKIANLTKYERVKQRRHVNGRGLGVFGETVEDVEDVLADVVAAVDRYRVGDHGAFVAGQGRMGERADEYPGEETNVIDAFHKFFRSMNCESKFNFKCCSSLNCNRFFYY